MLQTDESAIPNRSAASLQLSGFSEFRSTANTTFALLTIMAGLFPFDTNLLSFCLSSGERRISHLLYSLVILCTPYAGLSVIKDMAMRV